MLWSLKETGSWLSSFTEQKQQEGPSQNPVFPTEETCPGVPWGQDKPSPWCRARRSPAGPFAPQAAEQTPLGNPAELQQGRGRVGLRDAATRRKGEERSSVSGEGPGCLLHLRRPRADAAGTTVLCKSRGTGVGRLRLPAPHRPVGSLLPVSAVPGELLPRSGGAAGPAGAAEARGDHPPALPAASVPAVPARGGE